MAADSDYAATARHQAREILSQPAFTHAQHSPPRPLAGVLHAVGRALMVVFAPVFRWIRHELFDPAGRGLRVVFGSFAPVVAIVIAAALGAFLAFLLIRRRTRLTPPRGVEVGAAVVLDPSSLEKEADRRAGDGEFAEAVRLRFAAGLRRLELAGLLTEPDTRTGHELTHRIGSPTFERLAEQHESIAYAAAGAEAHDDERARRDWPVVPDEARRHRKLIESGAR